GSPVAADGSAPPLTAARRAWGFPTDNPAPAVFNVKSSTGAVVYSESRTLNAGAGTFNWNGRGTNGQMMPDGDYTLSITARDASGNVTSIATEVEGTVDGVDLSQTPPVLKIGSKSFSLDKINQLPRHAT